jgi:transposase
MPRRVARTVLRGGRRSNAPPLPGDAVSAARAALSGRAAGAPKGRDGQVEAIRALMVAKRSARSVRTQTTGQARALIVTGPDDVRARFAAHGPAQLVAELAVLRPRPGSMVRYHTLLSLRELGRRAQFLDAQLARLDESIVPLVTARAPGLLALYGVGPDTAAMLLVAAGDHPGRLRSEAAWAHLCATAPLSASSGKVTRYRPGPGGDRQAGHALYRIVITRLSPARPPAPTPAGAPKKACPRKKSSAASSVTSPARSTPACAFPSANQAPGGGLTL